MPRYAMIDNYSGFIWGVVNAESPIEAARSIDTIIGTHDLSDYDEVIHPNFSNETGYMVFFAPDGFEVVDGQSEAEINLVYTLPAVCFVRVTRKGDLS